MKKYFKFIPIIILAIISVYVYSSFFDHKEYPYLKVVFLDVGQGDAIFIETKDNKQILIDSGPDSKVLSGLQNVMPFADRSLDLVIITHHDNDHIGGLPIIMDNYKIDNLIETDEKSSSSKVLLLDKKIINKNINEIFISKKKRILLGEDIYLDILFPNNGISKLEGNDTSIVCRLIYGDKSFMFMGDAPLYTENSLLYNESLSSIDSDVLKLGHHGSRTSSSLLWLEKVSPDFAIISAGKNNKYGHPHKEVLDRLNKLNIPYFATYDIGNITFLSDGKSILRK